MKEIHIVAFVQTEWNREGQQTFQRRENRVAFKKLLDAYDFAESEAYKIAQTYMHLGANVRETFDSPTTGFHYSTDNGITGTWNFYVDSVNLY